MESPSYSIVIPVYKRVFGFREALQSALNVKGCQEIVVVDDNSDHEQFRAIVDALGEDRIKYHKNEKNLGIFGNWNRGIELAQGDFVSVLCSDDVIEPDACEEFQRAYAADPAIDVFFGSFCTFTDTPDRHGTHRSFPAGKMDGLDLIADAVHNGPGFSVLSIIRRTTARRYPFVAKPHSGNDWLWIYGNASSFNLHSAGRPINYWRRHPDQDASKSQSVTTDCWPLMYQRMEQQLRAAKHPLADKARNRARGVILSWLLNDYANRANYFPRLRGSEADSNEFLRAAKEIIVRDWMLSGLLNSEKGSAFFYQLGRIARKLGYYPATF